MTTESDRLTLCRAEEVSPDLPLRCEHDGRAYAVFELEGEYFVIADECSHGPGSLSDGFVDGCEVECPFHQGRFDFRTGLPTAAPCVDPVKSWRVHLIDGRVQIDPNQVVP
jgi:ethylbenzene dioxygenase ferredoxin subunit